MNWMGHRVSADRIEVLDGLDFKHREPWQLYVSGQGRKLDDELARLGDRPQGAVIGLLGSLPLVSKTRMWVGLVKRYGRAKATRLVPPTWILNHPPDRENLATREGPFIVKAPGKQRRQGLTLVDSAEQALKSTEGVVQPVLPTMLLAGHAFHMRCYVLVKVGPAGVDILLHRVAKLVYTTHPASAGGFEGLITRGDAPVPEGAPRTVGEFARTLEDPNAVLGGIPRCLKAVMTTFPLRAPAAATVAVMPFGVDLLVGPEGQVRLLEVNRRPDLTGRNAEDSKLKQKVWLDTLRVAGVVSGKVEADILASVPA
jgi:hypothetical protein